MQRIFGKKVEKPPPPSLTDASGRIDSRVVALDEKIGKLELELKKYKEQLKKAKGPAAKNIKRRAMDTLKRKRMYEQQRDNMVGQAFNIEQTSMAIESVKDTQMAVEAMKSASVALRQEQQKISLDDVEDLHDDLAEISEEMNEINEIMGTSYGVGDDIDESELEAELACFEDDLEDFEDEGVTDTVPSYLPDAPTEEVQPVADGEVANSLGDEQVDEFGLPVAPASSS